MLVYIEQVGGLTYDSGITKKTKVNVMPKKYTKKTPDGSGYESGYESDGGTQYSPERKLGKGSYALARLFKSRLGEKKVAVLNPLTDNLDEAKRKHRFFRGIYPERQSHLFEMLNDYRLILPYISGTEYYKLSKTERITLFITLFKAAIEAIQDCHRNGFIVIDVKEDNILYDAKMGKSFLIDGGISAPIGAPVVSSFQKSNKWEVEDCKCDFLQMAPECWSVSPTEVLATPAMDVYALGVMMRDIRIELQNSNIEQLINSCIHQDPKKRPTLEALAAALDDVTHDLTTPKLKI